MEWLSSTFSRLKGARYNRFTAKLDDGDGERHVEVKLSEEGTEDTADVEHGRSSGRLRRLPCGLWQTVCYLVLGFLLIFLIGYLVGCLSSPRNEVQQVQQVEQVEQVTQASRGAEEEMEEVETEDGAVKELDWKDIIQLLSDKLTAEAFDKSLGKFKFDRRSAGSDNDTHLGNLIFDEFKSLEMEPWTNIHHVQLQIPNSNRPNRVVFNTTVYKPSGYLAYSATGNVEGKLAYGNYGRKEDLDSLQTKGVELKGSVLLLRAGKLSFAEQVNNAAAKEAAAVLIYPDPQNYHYEADTALYGHVHLGSGDPYTPGFPSFNHTQFPPTPSSGLPKIPAQTISTKTALALLKSIGGPEAGSGFIGGFNSLTYRLGGSQSITVEVNNVLVNKEIHNVFGVIKGFIDPDCYVVLGAQRDAWGNGYARAAVGSSVLLELAKAVHQMVETDMFRPRRSLVFASWSAGAYGNVGATEWLEGYMTSIDKKVSSYISLDGVVMGRGALVASASPLLYSLLEDTMKEVKSPVGSGTVYDMMGTSNWKANVLKPMSIDDPAYPFLAFAGIPSISFHFTNVNTEEYPYYGTDLDTDAHLNTMTNDRTSQMMVAAARFGGQMALRLVHDHLLRLDVSRYQEIVLAAVKPVYNRVRQLSQSGELKDVSPMWLSSARGSFNRAANSIMQAVSDTDPADKEACRIHNAKLMSVERTLLSPYVSPIDTSFRHLLLGRGPHTLASLAQTTDMEHLRVQLALATWTLQGCANAMAGDIWDIDNEI